jgi:hypothetical protein
MTIAPGLGPMHLSANRNFEIQRPFDYEVTFSGLPFASINLTLTVDSFALPTYGNAPIELGYGNSRVKVAGQTMFSDTSLEIRDVIGADTENLIQTWQNMVYNPKTDRIGWASDYKVTGTVYEYSPDWSVARTWSLLGCWPSQVTYGQLSYESSDKKLIQVSISFDKAYRN